MISTVAQREPELRAELQQDIDFFNSRIAQLQAGPVPISQAEADFYRRSFQTADIYKDSFSTPAAKALVPGLFG